MLERHDGHRGDRYELSFPPGSPARRRRAGTRAPPDHPRCGAPVRRRAAGHARPCLLVAAPAPRPRRPARPPRAGGLHRPVPFGGLPAPAAACRVRAGHRHRTRPRRRARRDCWTTGPVAPETAGHSLGARDWYQGQAQQYRAERRVWRAWLAEQAELREARHRADVDQACRTTPTPRCGRSCSPTAVPAVATGPGPDPGPPEPAMTSGDEAIALLTEALGAVLLADPSPWPSRRSGWARPPIPGPPARSRRSPPASARAGPATERPCGRRTAPSRSGTQADRPYRRALTPVRCPLGLYVHLRPPKYDHDTTRSTSYDLRK